MITRRGFLAGVGATVGGLVLGLSRGGQVAALTAPFDDELTPNAFIAISPGGAVRIVCARSEMGQGVRSSLPLLIADELGADPARVVIVQADGDATYGNQNTDGSSSVRGGAFGRLRQLGATLRVMLVTAAAKQWSVAPAECSAHDHAVHHAASKRSLPFGELVAAARTLPVPKGAPLRPRTELAHLGRANPLVDARALVTGRAQFGADIRLEGMLTAIVLRPPTVYGKVRSYDAKRALAVPGVRKVIELPPPRGAAAFQPLGGVAVIADHTWAALRGRAALDVTWDLGDNARYDSTSYRATLLETVRAPQTRVRTTGDADATLRTAKRTVSAEYYTPHLAHAPMEPPAAVARVTSDGCEVWAPTQHPQSAKAEVAKALGLAASKVTVHVTFLGGAFGRKSKPDFIVEAALCSRAAGAPVRVQWTRTDDLQHDYFHTVAAQRLDAALDDAGAVTAWRHRIAFPPIPATFDREVARPSSGELNQGPLDVPLAIPNVAVEAGSAKAHVRIGWLRSVCNIFHAFAIGSFIDEIAAARRADPRATWLALLGAPRHVTPKELGVASVDNYGASLADYPIDVGRMHQVIERVCAAGDWDTARQRGRALGLAAHRSFLSYVAVVVSAELRGGQPSIDEVWVCADVGTVVNRDRVLAQLEGAVHFGLSLALFGRITMKDGAVEQTNFRDYRIARIGQSPRRIHIELIDSTAPPGGVGEPGVPPIAPAIANALFALTGERRRELPLFASAPTPRP